jgi:hypothetical protein
VLQRQLPPGKHLLNLPERVPSDLTSISQPNDAAVQGALKAHAGRKFTAVLDDIRPALRNAIAHLDPDGTLLVQDRWDDLQKVEQVLPGLRWITRQLLDSELSTELDRSSERDPSSV